MRFSAIRLGGKARANLLIRQNQFRSLDLARLDRLRLDVADLLGHSQPAQRIRESIATSPGSRPHLQHPHRITRPRAALTPKPGALGVFYTEPARGCALPFAVDLADGNHVVALALERFPNVGKVTMRPNDP